MQTLFSWAEPNPIPEVSGKEVGLIGWQALTPLAIPFGLALVLNAIYAIWMLSKPHANPNLNETTSDSMPISAKIRSRLRKQGGWVVVAYSVARLIGCISLLGLSLATLRERTTFWEVISAPIRETLRHQEIFMALTYASEFQLFCSIWSLATLVLEEPPMIATTGNYLVLFSAFCLYTYRDLWPLATYSEVPQDSNDGVLLWCKLAVLFTIAVLIPLFVPSIYVPVDPKNPMPVPNAEQTCSLFSFITYTYLSPVVHLTRKIGHLDPEHLPPLRDTDASRHIIKTAFPHMDPYQNAKPRHIFFTLIRSLREEYTLMVLAIVLASAVEFIPSVCILHILQYLETGETRDNVRPLFWILGLFLGPSLHAILWQLYIFYGTRAVTHAEVILTELIFEHSLRIRFKAESIDDEKDDDASVVGSVAESLENASSSTSITDSQSSIAPASSVAKGKSKMISSNSAEGTKAAAKDAKNPKDIHLLGKINNLVTSDLYNITTAKDFFFLVVNMPIQVVICIVFLYKLLGWSSFVGFGCLVVLFPAPGYATKLIQSSQKRKMEKTDARVQAVTEVLSVLKMVKLFGWERNMQRRIESEREDELRAIWRLKVLQSLIYLLNSIIPLISMIATYATYTIVMKEELTASIIFSSLTVFALLRGQLFGINSQILRAARAKVSLDRINDFLKETELLDSFRNANSQTPLVDLSALDKNAIGFKDASFVWSNDVAIDGRVTSRRAYRLRVQGELLFKQGCINLIVGPTGSGKTSLLMALLGEMHFIGAKPDSGFNLPREGGVAYAAQESWVQNETIRSNILFGSPYDEARYRQVLTQCALDQDLKLFDAGDNTEVGEKGITLSGGQKARLTLARAIYSSAKIILLDDIFAALDVHTSSAIVENCLKGDLVKGRTVILVTHNVALLVPIASFIVSINQDGSINTQDNIVEPTMIDDVNKVVEQLRSSTDEIGQEDSDLDSPTSVKKEVPVNGKLVLKEEVAQGHISWKSWKLFFDSLGGGHPVIFFIIFLSGFMLAMSVSAFQKWFLGYWGTQYEARDPSEVRVYFYCALYSSIVFLGAIINNATQLIYAAGTIKASRTINTLLVESVLGSTLRWLDETPSARIITRFTQDIQTVDSAVPDEFYGTVYYLLALFTSVSVVVIFTPIFFIPAFVVSAYGFYLGSLFLTAQLSATREKSNARAPVLGHFSAAIAGIVSVRAYGAQASFKEESLNRIDKYTRINRITYNLNRWIGIRMDLLGGVFSAALAAYLVYGTSIGASNTGFSLNMTAELCTVLLYFVRYFNDFDVEANSLERIQAYLDIDHEPKATKSGTPPAAWPTSGSLVVENLSARYSQNGPVVLHNISFEIKSGQRIGIVGRTGSGKSSLTLALLRCIATEGTVYFDGVNTGNMNLDGLRSNITIIPQTPELISGTLRRNLDPFDQHDDVTLNDALRAAGLFELQDALGEARITLDSNIASAGGNLSVGERQILALARAMIRGSKLLILDEATSAIDHKTDAVIQATLRHKLGPDVTVITVAHRLQTIMDSDRIMVLDEGRLAEFDTPKALLERESGIFKSFVDGSANMNALYEVAGANVREDMSTPIGDLW